MLVLLDTNFLLYAAKYKIDIEVELERVCDEGFKVAVPKQVISELKMLSVSKGLKGEEKAAAKLAIQLIKDFEVKEVEAGDADSALLKLAGKGDVIATLDKELKKKFKNGKILSIRQKKYIAFVSS